MKKETGLKYSLIALLILLNVPCTVQASIQTPSLQKIEEQSQRDINYVNEHADEIAEKDRQTLQNLYQNNPEEFAKMYPTLNGRDFVLNTRASRAVNSGIKVKSGYIYVSYDINSSSSGVAALPGHAAIVSDS